MEKRALTYLHILLVLSFIGSGTMLLSGFSMTLMQPMLRTYYETHPELFPEQLATAADMVLQVPRAYYLFTALLNGLSLAGAILMWRPKAIGFHCYTLAKLLLIAVPLLFLGRAYINIGDIMLTLLFVVAYWLLLRQLGVFGPNKPADTPQDTDQQ
ncbi:MAG: hypothetical protein K5650_08590 [Bacteroidales bacterium]|nr:hypothetical protein [Bacteroidales bacterium]